MLLKLNLCAKISKNSKKNSPYKNKESFFSLNQVINSLIQSIA